MISGGRQRTWMPTRSRVTLDSVVRQFRSGASAEEILQDFPYLALSDIYAVIAYYLQHAAAVEDYLHEQAQGAEAVRRDVEGHLQTKDLRDCLRRQRARAVA